MKLTGRTGCCVLRNTQGHTAWDLTSNADVLQALEKHADSMNTISIWKMPKPQSSGRAINKGHLTNELIRIQSWKWTKKAKHNKNHRWAPLWHILPPSSNFLHSDFSTGLLERHAILSSWDAAFQSCFFRRVLVMCSAFHHGTDSFSTKNEAPPSVRWHQVLSIVHRTRRCWKHQSLGHGTCPAWHCEDQLQLLAVVWHTGFEIWMIQRFYK